MSRGAPTDAADRRQAAGRLALRTTLGAAGGTVAGVAVAALDQTLELELPVVIDHAQMLLGTLVGAAVTVVVFALWMRTVVVGLLSDQVSPRIVTGYLDDGYQRWLVGVGAGIITFLAVTVLALPDLEAPEGAPALTTVLGTAASLVAIAGVLWSVQVAVRDLSLPHVIRRLADEALAVLDLHADADHSPPDHDVGEDVERLTSPDMGWVTHVDRAGLLACVPRGTTVTLDADVGDFVAPQQVIVRCDQQLDDEQREELLDHLTLGRTRSPEHDLAYAIQPLVDVAEHAMGASSNDTSTAHEALVHLRAVLHQLLLRGPITGWWTDGEDRWLRIPRVREPIDHVTTPIDRLAAVASTRPMRADLGKVISHLRTTADAVGDERTRDALDARLENLEDRG